MSRSNQIESAPHPCTRWMEWQGSEGYFHYYDKEKAQKVNVGDNLTFIVLDQLATVKGWHDQSESGIYSNEVRNLTTDILSVKSFKGAEIATGLYKDIKDRVKVKGGKFTQNVYVAIKDGQGMIIGSVMFSGAALNAWIEFAKENKANLYKKSVKISGSTESSKGVTKFKIPTFKLIDVSQETDLQAIELDKTLQEYLNAKLTAKTDHPQAEIYNTERLTPEEADLNYTEIEDDLPW
jgi:hypothetical protein